MEFTVSKDTSLTNFSLCLCCLESLCSKSLWTEYIWMGQTEVYGEMLKQCFNITWPKDENGVSKQICEVCITRLRNAYYFRKKVIDCQSRLTNNLVNRNVSVQKMEEHENGVGNGEDDVSVQKMEEHENSVGNGEDDASFELSENETNCTKKENFLKRLNTYRRERLKRGISKGLITEQFKRQKFDARKLVDLTKEYREPRENTRLLLQYSTICPFKSYKGQFRCFYCKKQYVIFDELREHTKEVHSNVSLLSLMKNINRPHDRVKADVSDITCKICTNKMENITDLIDHLTEKHGKKFNNEAEIKPQDCIIGYELSDGKYRCCVCKTDFFYFYTLSKHMNEHSTNYICDTCGKCFVLPERLKCHMRFHNTEKVAVKCETCGMVCASNKVLKAHIRYVHKNRCFVCSICNEYFRTHRLRMQHLVEKHGRTPVVINCKECPRKFFTSNSLKNHMLREHLKIPKEPKFGCLECGRMFTSKYQLENHGVVHSGERNHECEVCHKRYSRLKTLKEHLKIHKNDRRWSCGACAQLFVQKCSLKNHIRVHHANMEYTDMEELIIYKKTDEN